MRTAGMTINWDSMSLAMAAWVFVEAVAELHVGRSDSLLE